MSVSKDEYLSALVDGELGEFEHRRMVTQICEHDEDRARWARYHLIGEVLREGRLTQPHADLAGRIHAALEQEEALHAPAALRRTASHRLAHVAKPVIGFAMAASVAVVSVVMIQDFTQGPQQGVAPALAEAVVVPQGAQPVVRVAQENVQPTAPSAEAAARLNSYLVNHSEYAARQGMLSQVRVVGYSQTEE